MNDDLGDLGLGKMVDENGYGSHKMTFSLGRIGNGTCKTETRICHCLSHVKEYRGLTLNGWHPCHKKTPSVIVCNDNMQHTLKCFALTHVKSCA